MMTSGESDRVEATVLAFLDYLEGHGEYPQLQDLTETERREALQLMTLIEGGRGIDPLGIPAPDRAISPLLQDRSPSSDVAGTLSGVIASLESWGRPGLKVLSARPVDVQKAESADLFLRVGGLSIALRLVERVPAGDWANDPELPVSADLIFLQFPETSAVAFVGSEPDNPCVIVEPQEVRDAIEVPTGGFVSPRFRRVALPLGLALTRFLEEVEVMWDEPPPLSGQIESDFNVEEAALRAAMEVLIGLARQGRRAHIPEKRATWSKLGDREVQAVVRLVTQAHRIGLHEDAVGAAMDELVEGAA